MLATLDAGAVAHADNSKVIAIAENEHRDLPLAVNFTRELSTTIYVVKCLNRSNSTLKCVEIVFHVSKGTGTV